VCQLFGNVQNILRVMLAVTPAITILRRERFTVVSMVHRSTLDGWVLHSEF